MRNAFKRTLARARPVRKVQAGKDGLEVETKYDCFSALYGVCMTAPSDGLRGGGRGWKLWTRAWGPSARGGEREREREREQDAEGGPRAPLNEGYKDKEHEPIRKFTQFLLRADGKAVEEKGESASKLLPELIRMLPPAAKICELVRQLREDLDVPPTSEALSQRLAEQGALLIFLPKQHALIMLRTCVKRSGQEDTWEFGMFTSDPRRHEVKCYSEVHHHLVDQSMAVPFAQPTFGASAGENLLSDLVTLRDNVEEDEKRRDMSTLTDWLIPSLVMKDQLGPKEARPRQAVQRPVLNARYSLVKPFPSEAVLRSDGNWLHFILHRYAKSGDMIYETMMLLFHTWLTEQNPEEVTVEVLAELALSSSNPAQLYPRSKTVQAALHCVHESCVRHRVRILGLRPSEGNAIEAISNETLKSERSGFFPADDALVSAIRDLQHFVASNPEKHRSASVPSKNLDRLFIQTRRCSLLQLPGHVLEYLLECRDSPEAKSLRMQHAIDMGLSLWPQRDDLVRALDNTEKQDYFMENLLRLFKHFLVSRSDQSWDDPVSQSSIWLLLISMLALADFLLHNCRQDSFAEIYVACELPLDCNAFEQLSSLPLLPFASQRKLLIEVSDHLQGRTGSNPSFFSNETGGFLDMCGRELPECQRFINEKKREDFKNITAKKTEFHEKQTILLEKEKEMSRLICCRLATGCTEDDRCHCRTRKKLKRDITKNCIVQV
eukprot:g35202.t1